MNAPGGVVVALGGNALAEHDTRRSSVAEQAGAARIAFRALAGMIDACPRVLICHGNGPQVGSLLHRSELTRAAGLPRLPLDSCVADTAGGLGYTLARELRNTLSERRVDREVATIITQVAVDEEDLQSRKPVGARFPAAEGDQRRAEGWSTTAAGEGWLRRTVPSPQPREVLELSSIRRLWDDGVVVIAGGGGGVPVSADQDGMLTGVEAVIDKDLVAALLARELKASRLLILTDIDCVRIAYGTPEEAPLAEVSSARLRALQRAGHFPQGSMGPKVEAALRFVEATGQSAAIGALPAARQVLGGDTGTQVVPSTCIQPSCV